MLWPRKRRRIDLTPFEDYLAEQPRSNLPESLDPTGPVVAWNRPLDIRLGRIDLDTSW